jgi:hypothetical protein
MGIAISTGHRGFVLSLLFIALAPNISSARSLQLSNQVTDQEVGVIKHDLSNDLTLVDGLALRQLMGISDLSDGSLKQWLSDRVGYIIGEKENLKENLLALQENYQYQNAGIFPDFEKPTKDINHQKDSEPLKGKVAVVMSNVGMSFYYIGKSKEILVGYKFTSKQGSETTVAMTSPRVGIIQVGEGLFGILPNPKNPASIVNTWFRLSTFFHEAHHSDGNAKSLGFTHAVCPESKGRYAGFNACDRESNGPYAVEAFIVRQARVTCETKKTCDAGESEMLKKLELDAYSRIIDRKVIDPRPEGTMNQGS